VSSACNYSFQAMLLSHMASQYFWIFSNMDYINCCGYKTIYHYIYSKKKNWTCYICIINKMTYSSFEYSKFNRAALTSHCSSSLLVCSKEFPLQKTVPIKSWEKKKKINTSNMLWQSNKVFLDNSMMDKYRNRYYSHKLQCKFRPQGPTTSTTSCHFHPLLCHTFGLWLH
jgi:hypothetical protein